MASSFDSFDALGSPTNLGSSVTKRCRSVKRISSGFWSGNLSASSIPMSSASSQVRSLAMLVSWSFGNVVAVPRWNLDHYLARLLDDRLAAQARLELQIGSHVELVGFVVFHGTEKFLAFLHHDVAGGAGAVAAAGVLEVKTEVHGDVEQRLRLAVVLVGELAVLELKGLVLGEKRDLHRICAGRVDGGGTGSLGFFVGHKFLFLVKQG